MDTLACAEATCLWLTKKFANSYATLQKLESEGKFDLKLAHNLLVAEHAVVGSAEADRIASQLELIANERLSAEDSAGSTTTAASSDVAVTSGGRPRSSGTLEVLPLVPVRDDLAVAQLNRAILLYHQHRYASAAALLEPLAANVEALAEGTAVRVLTLLLDIHIEGRQLPRAVALLRSLERLHGTLAEAYVGDRAAAAAAAAGAQQQQQHSQQAHAPGGVGEARAASSAAVGGAAAGPGAGMRPRALALPRVSRWTTESMERSRALLDATDRPLAAPDLKLLIKLYRTRLHALAHNTRAAKRELKAVMSALNQQQHQQQHQQPSATGHGPAPPQPQQQAGGLLDASPAASALMLAVRAQLELYRGRSRKATKLLLGMLQDSGFAEPHRPLLLNNLGLVHHHQGKHTLALLYLSQALVAAEGRGQSAAQAPQQALSGPGTAGGGAAAGVPIPAVMYNAGLQHLMLHSYEAARRCFAAAASHYVTTPLLWLRTAEAALGLYRRHQQQQDQRRRQELVARGGSAAAPPYPGGCGSPLVECVIRGGGTALDQATVGGFGAQNPLPVQPRRLVLPTGVAPSPAEVGPDAAELLSEAVVALQTALQQLDAQQEAHEQWQSSSSKLEEGLSLAAQLPVAAAAATGGGNGGGGSAGGGNGGGGGSAGGVGGGSNGGEGSPASTSGVTATPPATEDPYMQPPPQLHGSLGADQTNHHQRPPLQLNGRGGGADDARQGPPHATVNMANGVHEPQGTDASAALSEELCAVRRAVLANLAYAHLQAEDWCAALQAAQALLTISGPGSPGAAVTGGASPGPECAASAADAAATAAAAYAFLAHNYAAEALCHLDRPADAVEYLSLWLMTAQEREAQQGQSQQPVRSCSSQKSDEEAGAGGREEGETTYPLGNAAALAALTGPAALAATAINLGAVFASQGELDQAAALVRQALALQPGNANATLLLVYCELAAGNTPAALALLKQRGQPLPL